MRQPYVYLSCCSMKNIGLQLYANVKFSEQRLCKQRFGMEDCCGNYKVSLKGLERLGKNL